MSYQKIRPCPRCGSENLSVYKYDSGWQYVECDGPGGCIYRGPGTGSIKDSIKLHNADVIALPSAQSKPAENAGEGQ